MNQFNLTESILTTTTISPERMEKILNKLYTPRYVDIITYIILFLIGSPPNYRVLKLLIQGRIWRQSRHHLLLLNLAIADSIVVFIMIPGEVLKLLLLSWRAGNIICKLFQFIRVFGLYQSSFILVCISIDRFYAVVHPFEYQSVGKLINILIIVSWVLSFVVSLPQTYVFALGRHRVVKDYYGCYASMPIPWLHTTYNVLSLFFMYIGPLLVIIICYLRICFATLSRPTFISSSSVSKTTNRTEMMSFDTMNLCERTSQQQSRHVCINGGQDEEEEECLEMIELEQRSELVQIKIDDSKEDTNFDTFDTMKVSSVESSERRKLDSMYQDTDVDATEQVIRVHEGVSGGNGIKYQKYQSKKKRTEIEDKCQQVNPHQGKEEQEPNSMYQQQSDAGTSTCPHWVDNKVQDDVSKVSKVSKDESERESGSKDSSREQKRSSTLKDGIELSSKLYHGSVNVSKKSSDESSTSNILGIESEDPMNVSRTVPRRIQRSGEEDPSSHRHQLPVERKNTKSEKVLDTYQEVNPINRFTKQELVTELNPAISCKTLESFNMDDGKSSKNFFDTKVKINDENEPISELNQENNDENNTISTTIRSESRLLKKHDEIKRKILRQTLLIVITYTLCWFPYAFMVLWHQIDDVSAMKFPDVWAFFFFTFAVSNSAVNPYIYGRFLNDNNNNRGR